MFKVKNVQVTSSKRVEGTDSNFAYVLNIPALEGFTHVMVTECSIPKTFYLVTEGANTFTVRVGVTNHVVTLPIGNYSRKSFQNKLNTLLAVISPNLSASYLSTATDPETGKYHFSMAAVTPVQFIFGNTTLAAVMGFKSNSTNVFILGTGEYYIDSVNVCSFITESTLFIHSDIVAGDNHSSGNVLQEVFCSVGEDFYSAIYRQATDVRLSSRALRSGDISTARFWLRNEDGIEMSLNGVNMVFTLRFFRFTDPNQEMRDLVNAGMQLLALKLDRIISALSTPVQTGGGRVKQETERWMAGYQAGLEYARTASPDNLDDEALEQIALMNGMEKKQIYESSDDDSDDSSDNSDYDPEDEYFRGMSTAST